ncbi:acyl-CoA dehydratase activase [Desulfobotulus sp. H1]|uniref:Acyl-CoA dehydratase activase n=1 Tax=Desulfobotulus pelophilus TaxID=2823377 RepID=A0ABT3N8W0_9BACT|nr:acyl-CoA dehydratase activase [Desulfobotulus pelophilus]MCW7753884.1 acyl-CoA dehydratase activase [Desulfobotulus pelophilus]
MGPTFTGLDIGSRSIEMVVLREDCILREERLPTTFDPKRQIRKLLQGLHTDRLIATGYGRGLVQDMGLPFEVTSLTEIKAHALAAAHLFPGARTVLDIGGQDTKAIRLRAEGRVLRFEMNDRCAAGTGKFLEYTAAIFQIPVEDFGTYALRGDEPPLINSMCTVFAETEATSLMAQGVSPENIALGLHLAIVRRTVSMLRRTGLEKPLVFAGGVAHNPCIRFLICKELQLKENHDLCIAASPEMAGALGAALWGAEEFRKLAA